MKTSHSGLLYLFLTREQQKKVYKLPNDYLNTIYIVINVIYNSYEMTTKN